MSSFMGSLASLASFNSRVSAETTGAARQLCQSDPLSVAGRFRLCLVLFCVPSWPALLSTVVTTVRLVSVVRSFITIHQLYEGTYCVERHGELITSLHEERNTIAILLPENNTAAGPAVNRSFRRTDRALAAWDCLPEFTPPDSDYHTKGELTRKLKETREVYANSQSSDPNRTASREWYSGIISSMMASYPPAPDTEISALYFTFYRAVIDLKREGAVLSDMCLNRLEHLQAGTGSSTPDSDTALINYMFVFQDMLDFRHDDVQRVLNSNESDLKFNNDAIMQALRNASARELELNDSLVPSLHKLYNICSTAQLDRDTMHTALMRFLRERSLSPAWNYQRNMMAFYSGILLIQIPALVFLLHNACMSTECIHDTVAIFISRTRELKGEKRKSELLLQEMLPRSIAKQLKLGLHVHAMHYEVVTVYFSEVPDFTEISALSGPLQLVTLLNSIYNFMDSKLELYDVYKVETIGSVYMVASGLPVKNADRHVSEVASLAIDTLEATNEFVIPHLPDRRLKLRIGAHTGPVVAGVVGNKAPRYCLFGDTVNTASRMQSNGEVFRIHISNAMKEALDKIGGYTTEHRGSIQVKGKGSMNTHWLIGKVLFRSRSKVQVTMVVDMKEGLLVQDI